MQTLAYCAGGDGNLLLNVGPMPNGEIEPRQVRRLRKVAHGWPSTERASTARGAARSSRARSTAATRKGNSIYLHVFHVFKWGGDRIALPRSPGGSSPVHSLPAARSKFGRAIAANRCRLAQGPGRHRHHREAGSGWHGRGHPGHRAVAREGRAARPGEPCFATAAI